MRYPHFNITYFEKQKRIEISDIIKLDNGRTQISPTTYLGRRMSHCKGHFLHTLEYGFIIYPYYMVIHLSHLSQGSCEPLHIVNNQVGKYAYTPLQRIHQIFHQGVECEEHYVCHCTFFYEIRGGYQCLLTKTLAQYAK